MTAWWVRFTDIIKTFTIFDFVDVLCVSFLIYMLIQLVKEIRAAQLVKGIAVVLGVYLLAMLLQMQSMIFIMDYILRNGLIVLVVIFQPELRRALEQVGRTRISKLGIFNNVHDDVQVERARWKTAITAICEAVSSFSRRRTGALIVIERDTKLGDIIKTGTVINSDPSMELIGNVFFPNSPLHDGAMIVRGGKLYAAGCFLPLSENFDISKQLGTRHRAALGMSENSDAIVIVVSEESGVITVARNGVLKRNYTVDDLRTLLELELLKEKSEDEPRFKLDLGGRKKNEKA